MTIQQDILAELRAIRGALQPHPHLDIPPVWVRRAALSFDGFKSWTDAYKILCDYYEIPALRSEIDPSAVPKEAIACYQRYPPRVVTKASTMAHDTGIHEFFHHLSAQAGRTYERAPSEALTRAYVTAFLEGV